MHYKKTVKNERQRENLKSSKRKPCNLKRNPNKAISRLLSRTHTVQERLGWYLQCDERKKLLPKNTLTKLSFRNGGEIKTSQTKPEGVYQHYTYLTKKNAENNSYGRNEGMLITCKYIKTYNSLVKVSILSNLEYSNAVISWYIYHLTLL